MRALGIALTLMLLSACGLESPLPGAPPDVTEGPAKLGAAPLPDDDGAPAPDDLDGDAAPSCADVACGAGASCRLGDDGAPACVADACGSEAPVDESCPQSCATGYLVVDGAATCGCCAVAHEPTFRTCFDEKDCAASEACDHSFCESTCPAGVPCPAVCAGRCSAASLVAAPL